MIFVMMLLIGTAISAPSKEVQKFNLENLERQLDIGDNAFQIPADDSINEDNYDDFLQETPIFDIPEDTVITDERDGPVGANYRYLLETSAGVRIEQEGTPGINGTSVIRGSYSYIAPNGETIEVTYIADENGFQPESPILPTTPTPPAYVAELIEFAAQQAAAQAAEATVQAAEATVQAAEAAVQAGEVAAQPASDPIIVPAEINDSFAKSVFIQLNPARFSVHRISTKRL